MIAILIVAFNRPDLLQKRLREIEGYRFINTSLYLSIDGPRKGNVEDFKCREQIIDLLGKHQSFNIIKVSIREVNFGCNDHIRLAISEVLMENEAVVVIEDDVSLQKMSLQSIIERTSHNLATNNLSPVISMSGLSGRNWFGIKNKNHWRSSLYFSAWGYSITRSFWNLHLLSRQKFGSDITVALDSKSPVWARFWKGKKATWTERFSRQIWDYEIQLTLFLEGILTIAPALRIVENEGLGDLRATHTRHKKPRFMKKSIRFNTDNQMDLRIQNKRYQNLWNWLDSNTWAGDGYLSLRGRRTGIRKFVKRAHVRLMAKKHFF